MDLAYHIHIFLHDLTRAVSDDMDRRHPSSFQQLEKVSLPRVANTLSAIADTPAAW